MSKAICWRCGNFKSGAWTRCPTCGVAPSRKREMAKSLFMTNHFFRIADLEAMSKAIKLGRKLNMDKKTEKEMLAMVGKKDTTNTSAFKMLEEQMKIVLRDLIRGDKKGKNMENYLDILKKSLREVLNKRRVILIDGKKFLVEDGRKFFVERSYASLIASYFNKVAQDFIAVCEIKDDCFDRSGKRDTYDIGIFERGKSQRDGYLELKAIVEVKPIPLNNPNPTISIRQCLEDALNNKKHRVAKQMQRLRKISNKNNTIQVYIVFMVKSYDNNGNIVYGFEWDIREGPFGKENFKLIDITHWPVEDKYIEFQGILLFKYEGREDAIKAGKRGRAQCKP